MKVKYLIIGAGISGLSFASFLNINDYLILEKEDEPGGLCRTIRKNGFVWDYAGHFFHFKDFKTKEYFSKVLEGEKCVNRIKHSKIYYNGIMIDYPFQANIHQLPKDEFIDCLYDLYFKEEKESYDSFKAMLYGKFGKGICDRFLIPYNEKLYACDLDILDENAMGRFFPYADLPIIIKNMKEDACKTYNDYFQYPYDGAETMINHLLGDIIYDNICFNQTVISINAEDKYVITTDKKIEYEFLINTMPFNNFIETLNIKPPSGIMNCNKVLVYNMGFDKEPIDKTVDWIYFPSKDINFYRVGFYSNILNQNRLSIYVEIGYKEDEEIDVQQQFEETMRNLKKCNIIDKHKLLDYSTIIIDPAYVHISSEAILYVNNILKKLEKKKIHSLGRYGEWTYCSMEDCYISARKLAYKLQKGEKIC